MPDLDLLENVNETRGTAASLGSVVVPFPVRTGETPLARAAGLRDIKRLEASDATVRHHEEIVAELDRRAMLKVSKHDVPELLSELGRRGFSWRDIAAIAGVSVPAIRKWRTGGTYSPERRTQLGRTAGLCDLVEEYLIPDPAGWLETPIVNDVPVTPMDLYLAGLEELVIDVASRRVSDPNRILGAFDPEWREKYRSDYEVFEASDGGLSIKAKRR